MRILPYKIGTDFSRADAKKLKDQICPKCGGNTVFESSGPLTDCELCEDCNLAFTSEEIDLTDV